ESRLELRERFDRLRGRRGFFRNSRLRKNVCSRDREHEKKSERTGQEFHSDEFCCRDLRTKRGDAKGFSASDVGQTFLSAGYEPFQSRRTTDDCCGMNFAGLGSPSNWQTGMSALR